MERSISVLRQRTTSFNPEAAAFNPVFSSPVPQDAAPVPTTSPTPPQVPDSAFPMAPMFNYSPFHAAGSMRSLYRRDPLTPAPVRLEDFLSPDVQALVKKLEEHPDVQEIRAPHTPALETTQAVEVIASPRPSLPPFTFPEPQPQPDYVAVDINELSAGLGLPAMKVDPNDEASPAASHKSRLSQAHPGALYGKLIGWALDKPLTAKGLADFLQNQDLHTPSEPPASTSVSPTRTVVHGNTETTRAEPEVKSTQEGDVPNSHRVAIPAPTETITIPRGPSAFQHQRRRSSASSASYRHHMRIPSNRRYPRRTSRAKRMDQGPMPSAADIYPDDAHWTPSAPIYEGLDYMAYNDQPAEQPQVIVDNVFNWPPPAQVYKPELAPTVADIDAADIDVLALMNELPEPSLDTLAKLDSSRDLRSATAFDLPCDERALTPAQLDGSRYGMRFYGIGYGDQWDLPKMGYLGETEPFRVRPMDHAGWGGWEWALRKGWGA
ncbi:hypothetical protein BU25DRAFT_490607 [Macroventuria anomochaeta]|uniref:Uncharacterized protein n=1 Tax=Macroventuria anomochaeta TaxID=301207 RepID=A0ACB6S3G1_9PLEO|nr:uncharacterized protein BU25DRAFT_490607 [Macroventuria anomochaeta]KAF2628483.1 hypothetical protein BU25DRAFT_490607 [Macroventuria anomochaeta]